MQFSEGAFITSGATCLLGFHPENLNWQSQAGIKMVKLSKLFKSDAEENVSIFYLVYSKNMFLGIS